MANAFLIVGVGGLGRGVCNHLKYELEGEFNTLERARTKVLVIDGPVTEAVYELPKGFQIDTSQSSPEFYRTTLSPADVIRRITQSGESHVMTSAERYISEWLTAEDARLIPTDALDPGSGFGGHRSPGHAFFYLDIDQIQRRLQQTYNGARALLGKGTATGAQVIVIVVASQSGGTGAGLFFDILHLLRDMVSVNHDQLLCFLTLPNTYHDLASSPGDRKRLNAQNFAGMLNLVRFMGVKGDFPTIIKYSDSVTVRNGQLVEVPFLVDGDVTHAKLNSVQPKFGVVPVISDFILTFIKDDSAAAAASNFLINWATRIAGADPIEKYAAFGVSSIRYPFKAVLQTFGFRFTMELYDQMLNPVGSAVNEGETVARDILNSMRFTQMVEDPTMKNAPLEPPVPPGLSPSFKALAGNIKVGLPSDHPFIYPHTRLPDAIPHSGVLFGKPTAKVKTDAEKKIHELREQADKWLGRQKENIVKKFVEKLEEGIWNIFYVTENNVRVPKTLRDSPNSIIIARDFLSYIIEKIKVFRTYVEREYGAYLFPDGPTKPNIIAVHLEKLKGVEKRLSKSKDSQLAYLVEAQRHLDLEIWDMLVKGIRDLADDLLLRANDIWDLVGDSANGWVYLLRSYRQAMEVRYYGEIGKREWFDNLLLRKYVPKTAGPAENRLFEEIVSPELEALKAQMSWTVAIDGTRANRYELILNTPTVTGYDDQAAANDLKDVVTGEKLQNVHYYNPYKHYHYALDKLSGPLNTKTLWDILALEYDEGWSKDEKIPAERKTEQDFAKQVASEFMVQSGVTLNYEPSQNSHEETYVFGPSAPNADAVGGLILQALKDKGATVSAHPVFSKEIRRVTVRLSVPIIKWKHYQTTQGDYIQYVDSPTPRILIDIYRNEQNGSRIRRLIERTVKNDFTYVLDPMVTAALYNYNVFRDFSVCYAMNLIPLQEGPGHGDPQRYYLPSDLGNTVLAEEWDIYSLLFGINTPERLLNGQWRSNSETQKRISALWEKEVTEAIDSGKLKDLLDKLEEAANKITFPEPPHGKISMLGSSGKEHLKFAMKAVIMEHVTSMRSTLTRNKGGKVVS